MKGTKFSLLFLSLIFSFPHIVYAQRITGGSITTFTLITLNSPGTCQGNAVTLTASPALSGATYTWSTGSTSTSNSITVNPAITTTYSVAVSVGSSTQTASTTVTVYPNPTATLSSEPICYLSGTGPVVATASGGTAPYTYQWTNGQTSSSAAFSTSAVGVTITDANNCAVTKTTTLNYAVIPATTMTHPTICEGQSTQIMALISGTPNPNYVWNTGASTSTITVAPLATTVYSLTVSNYSNGYCPKVFTTTV
ncbi:MAG TPA: SprB repeat-containing protein, partial [Bacteroidia bacterium]|nr:SprB repeat-containing protein [Bacteroidia bacterium]